MNSWNEDALRIQQVKESIARNENIVDKVQQIRREQGMEEGQAFLNDWRRLHGQ